jgi:antitoxin component YwqK of YwqJK toxin-antitoxin module
MKKLLLILLCLPMIGFGQVHSIDQFKPDLICPGNENHQPYYYPYQDLGLYTKSKLDLFISDYLDFGYEPVFTPDSFYVDVLDPLEISTSGSINYTNDTLNSWTNNVTTLLWPVNTELNCTYQNNKIESYNMTMIGYGNNGITDDYTYDISGQLVTKTRTDFFSSNLIWSKDFVYNSSNQLIEINYFTTGISTAYRTDILNYSSNGDLNNVSISDGRKYEYNYNISSGYCESILLYYDSIFVDTVCEYIFFVTPNNNDRLQEYHLKSYVCSGGTPSLELEERYSYTYDSFDRILTEKSYEDNGSLAHTWYYYYNNNPSSIIENYKSNKALLKVTDLLGRETKGTKNEVLFYIYDDGTVEKRIVIE